MKRHPYKMHFEIYGSEDSWHWLLKARNGMKLAMCPPAGFTSRTAAIRSVERLQDDTTSSTIYVNGKELT